MSRDRAISTPGCGPSRRPNAASRRPLHDRDGGARRGHAGELVAPLLARGDQLGQGPRGPPPARHEDRALAAEPQRCAAPSTKSAPVAEGGEAFGMLDAVLTRPVGIALTTRLRVVRQSTKPREINVRGGAVGRRVSELSGRRRHRGEPAAGPRRAAGSRRPRLGVDERSARRDTRVRFLLMDVRRRGDDELLGALRVSR